MSASPFFGPAIALPVIAAVVIIVVVGMRMLLRTIRTRTESTRAQALAGPATRLGLVAVPDDQLTDLPPFELLNLGSDRRASNVMRGSSAGASLVVFDYAFFDATKKGERFRGLHYSQDLAGATVCCVKGSWLSLPEFVMEPALKPVFKQMEAAVDQQLGDGKMASAVQALMHAAERMVEEAPGFEFTERPDVAYRIRGKDEPAVRALFTPRVLDYFRDRPGWIVEGRGDWLLLTFALRLKDPVMEVKIGATPPADEGRLAADRLETLVKSATETLDAFRTATTAS